MPATYAHYRFGAAMLGRMPADLRRTAKRHRRLFDVGLHGPDLFFYYRPVCPNRITALGSKFHRQTGREFFTRVCRSLRLEPSDPGQAYLYGALCHYVLDSYCHPMILEASADGLGHVRIETEFDRYLMELDGKESKDNLTAHIMLTPEEWPVVSRFYPGTEARHIRDSVKGMAAIRRVLEMPDGPLRSALTKTMSAGSGAFRDMLPLPEPDPACQKRNTLLFERYEQAAKAFPDMLVQLGAHLTYNAPLGEGFHPIFG